MYPRFDVKKNNKTLFFKVKQMENSQYWQQRFISNKFSDTALTNCQKEHNANEKVQKLLEN